MFNSSELFSSCFEIGESEKREKNEQTYLLSNGNSEATVEKYGDHHTLGCEFIPIKYNTTNININKF